eukprot:CAMPEP_0168559748 /NCGR_PEP_ID=MMETSP0413-20121227/10692_1 /TAXON_ID=136452 /ORGANISM="Filamoeba nolandi, Strain NC-AS-23-1" /LENGTH=336 /DNA_ID=CAMNT_0008591003 /DNA_START=34 /DNA_END=1041 /DNA_ORIENTATION=-
MATNLFGNVPQNKVLVEFRAGKMTLSGNLLTPDKRKGTVQLLQTPDGLINFVWRDRTTNAVEDEWFIFPEEVNVKKIKQGRTVVLEWKQEGRKLFYWLQEPTEEKDDEFVAKLNQYINNPPAVNEPSSGEGALDPNLLMSMLSQVQPPQQAQPPQQQPTQTQPTQPTAPTTQTPQTPQAMPQPTQAPGAPQQPRQAVQVADLQNFFASLGLPQSSANYLYQAQQPQIPKGPSLQQVLDPQLVTPVLENPDVQAQLLPLLPEGRRTPEELRLLFTSPQVQQSLETFNAAVQSGEITDLLGQFGIQTSPGPMSVVQFLQALQNQTQSQKPSDKKDNDK